MDQNRKPTRGDRETPGKLVRNYTVVKEAVPTRGGGPPFQREQYRKEHDTREHYRRKRGGFRRILTWMLVGMLWQLPAYYFLNQQVTQVMFPAGSATGLTSSASRTAEFHLTASRLTDPQVSYDDRYVVFQDSSRLEIYDFAQQKMIWQTVSRREGRILAYQWLPDREELLLFESGVDANPNLPGQIGVGIYSLEIGASQSGSAAPNIMTTSRRADTTTPQNGVSERYAASLPTSMQGDTITQISLSTATNLLYFTAQNQNQNQSHLYEVDVMKNLKVLSWQGEQVAHLAVSPDRGTIYYDARDNNNWQIVAEKAGQRVQVASNPLDKVLGIWNGKLYLGTVQDGNLVKVWTITDNQPSPKKPDFSLHWQGTVPWDSSSSVSLYGQSLVVSSAAGVYQINSAGSTLLAQGTNFCSPSGKYYYTVQIGSSGTVIRRNLV